MVACGAQPVRGKGRSPANDLHLFINKFLPDESGPRQRSETAKEFVMPTKTLPARPSLTHLKHQAKDLKGARQAGTRESLQRIREFHPRFENASDFEIQSGTFTLSDAYLTIAREYGYASWLRLSRHVQSVTVAVADLPIHDQISDREFRLAVDMIDRGDVVGLKHHLQDHPRLIKQRMNFEGMNYFRNPSLLEFCAENPIRHGTLPPNITEVVKVILDAGGSEDQASLNSALVLVASGCVPRICGVQRQLINLLCERGALPDSALNASIGHEELDATKALIQKGAQITLPAVAALGLSQETRRFLPTASPSDRHLAFAWSVLYGHIEIARLLLAAGEDPNRFNPVGAHAHSTPLHQAAVKGNLAMVQFLVQHGADPTVQDILFKGTPAGWAEHAGHMEVANFLSSVCEP